MASRIVLGSIAKTDVQEYFSFIAERERSLEPARCWYGEVMAAIRDLRHFPERHPFIPEVEEVGREIREAFIHFHRIIFSVHGSRRPMRSSDIGGID